MQRTDRDESAGLIQEKSIKQKFNTQRTGDNDSKRSNSKRRELVTTAGQADWKTEH
jgi:hypothetical protein